MDPLSDVLRVVRLTGAVFFTARLASPWCFRSPPPRELAPSLGIRPDCIALFHILVEGHCWLEVDGAAPIEVDAGTVIVLPHGHAHTVSSRLDLEPKPLGALLDCCTHDAVPVASYGSGGADARSIWGYLRWDQRFHPLMDTLPMVLVACPRRGVLVAEPGVLEAAPHRAGRAADALARAARPTGAAPDGVEDVGDDGWLETTLHYTIEEAEGKRPGSPAMLTRLVELLYVEVLCQYMRRLPEDRTGWLAGVRHPEVGRALRLLHEKPAQKWTVDALAREVFLSRSGLGRRFAAVVGEPPMRYLTGWRMQLAQNLLRRPELSIAQVAAQVGYDSDVAFHRVFKRHVGVPPGVWRRGVG